jgi:flavin-binding protein dodecin
MASEKGDTTPATAAAAAPATQRAAATIRYIDRPDVVETFADSVSGLVFDGQTLRIDFAVTRLDDVKPNAPLSGRRFPVCRLALPPAAAIELINRMQQIGVALGQAGVARPAQRSGEAPKAS